ncbi:LLM class flavin-dependent oxidoreductase [Brachybacterium sp. DNPG3]
MSAPRFLWYVPNQLRPGHRGDEIREDHGSLDVLAEHARAVEASGWEGALIGTGWHRPDTLTVATALAARTETFRPLVAVRPGYWDPAHLAASAATLDRLSGGRLLLNIVSGTDGIAEYGDAVTGRAERYARTQEFLHVLRRLWTEEEVTHHGAFYSLTGARLGPRPVAGGDGERPHPTLYFGGASPEAERVAAAEADVQLFWGETYAQIGERIARLRALSEEVGRRHAPLEFGLRVTVVARERSEDAWREAYARVGRMTAEENARSGGPTAGAAPDGGTASNGGAGPIADAHSADALSRAASVGQERVRALADTDDVLDDVLFTAPAKVGGRGAATTWLVGSFEEVAAALRIYRSLGIGHFVLSDTPYLREVERLGQHLLPLLRDVPSEPTTDRIGRPAGTSTTSTTDAAPTSTDPRRELHVV